MVAPAVTIDVSGYVAMVDEARSKDIPYATSLALTRTAQDAQIEVRRNVGRLFTLRNTWTQQGIRFKPAEKLAWPITAEVFTDTGNAAAPDYLLGQEDGDRKVAHNGHVHIAVPTKILRDLIGNSAVIPAALRPKELLSAYTGTHVSRRSAKSVRTPKAQQFVGFIQAIRGKLYIIGRKPKAADRQVYPLYLLIPEAQVKAVLGMEATVEKITAERFEQHWDDAWSEITR